MENGKKDSSHFIEDSIFKLLASGRKIDAIKLAQMQCKMNVTHAKKFVEGLEKKNYGK